ncbi:BnaC06g01450D [Brassica napus]|uniref:BnaC06g01450D protein n=1 Tax=Brassica napus TaxID=3708 RepID=A0A078G348_BRANA|nr:BnaC06g01450D [Brassica napus]
MAAMMNLRIVDAEADLNSAPRPVEIIGNLASIEKAEKLIHEVIAQVGVIIGRGDYQEHADKVESTDSGCPFYL